ncbi:MAG: phosphoserine aminotransferase [Azospira oryzae]|nr:MAG: phosphoserine aminotransferase [Azospira oryzae]
MKTNFTPGPSQLYFTVESHVKQAFREGIPSLSHRSKQFEFIAAQATQGVKQLLGVPDGFHVFFTGSATEIWERSIQNLVAHHSYHFVNGAFSKRYFEIAQQLGKHAVKKESPLGKGFTDFDIPQETELIALTHNETSTGVSLPMEFIHRFRDQFPNALIAVDAVSSLPYPQFDFTKIDTLFFSVQKGFGLPAGLGVWIVNDKCIAQADSLLAKGMSIGTYHNLPTLYANAKKNQTPETPNVLGIYLLAKVVEDFLQRGVHALRKETEYKAAILYNTLDQHPILKSFVTDKASRSQTVVVAECGAHTEAVTKALLEKGMQPGDGYGELKKTQLRFANFPTHSKEQFELLVDTLQAFN